MSRLGPERTWDEHRPLCGLNLSPDWDPAKDCGQMPALHIQLPADQGNISTCADHVRQGLAVPHQDHHPWGTWCGVPGAVWMPATDEAPSHCELDTTGLKPDSAAATALRKLVAAS
ncbi:hypothetical protein JNW90_10625 [Micromonospora sp. STR1s_5]|nr:hypothetical protein [Micromonospora sp. STR1s_5]